MWSSSGPAHSTTAPTARSTAIITSRSATGGRVRTTVTPGASKAAASCFSPEFLGAPEILIAPEGGGPGPKATASHGRPGEGGGSWFSYIGGRCATKTPGASLFA